MGRRRLIPGNEACKGERHATSIGKQAHGIASGKLGLRGVSRTIREQGGCSPLSRRGRVFEVDETAKEESEPDKKYLALVPSNCAKIAAAASQYSSSDAASSSPGSRARGEFIRA